MATKSRKNKKYPPKRAYTLPNLGAVILFIILVVSISIESTKSLLGPLMFFIFAPLIFFTSYYSGLALAKINYKLLKKKRIWLVCFQMFIIQILIIVFCSVVVFSGSNYTFIQVDVFSNPVNYYFERGLNTFIFFSLISFTPMFYAIWLYYGWVIVHHIPKPKYSVLTSSPKTKKTKKPNKKSRPYSDPYI